MEAAVEENGKRTNQMPSPRNLHLCLQSSGFLKPFMTNPQRHHLKWTLVLSFWECSYVFPSFFKSRSTSFGYAHVTIGSIGVMNLSPNQLFWVSLKLAGKKVVKLWLSRMCTGLFPCFSVSNNSPLPVVEAAWKGVRDEGLWSSNFPALRHVSSTSSDVLFLTRAQSGTSTGEGRQDQRCSS